MEVFPDLKSFLCLYIIFFLEVSPIYVDKLKVETRIGLNNEKKVFNHTKYISFFRLSFLHIYGKVDKPTLTIFYWKKNFFRIPTKNEISLLNPLLALVYQHFYLFNHLVRFTKIYHFSIYIYIYIYIVQLNRDSNSVKPS